MPFTVNNKLNKFNKLTYDLLSDFSIKTTFPKRYFYSPRKVNKCTRISISIYVQIFTRSMINAKSIHAARAAYYCLMSLTNTDVMNNVTKNNHNALTTTLVDLSLDHTKGAVQHKTTLLKHITNHKFASDEFYAYYSRCNPKIKWEPNTITDVRILNELTVINEYTRNFDSNIDWILATADSRPANFPHQIQENQDFWVNVMTKLDKSMGLSYKVIPQDEKSGMDMFKHATRGSLGLLTYDNTGANVQVTNKSTPVTDLIPYNYDRLQSIKQTLKADGNYDYFFPSIARCNDYLNSDINIFEVHKRIQQELWTQIQCDPVYTRSISFIFTKQVDYPKFTEREEAFRKTFVSLLGDKMYDLNSRQDCRDVYKAMLIAYKTQVDPRVIDKLYHLHNSAGVTLNTHFLHDIANLLKYGLL